MTEELKKKRDQICRSIFREEHELYQHHERGFNHGFDAGVAEGFALVNEILTSWEAHQFKKNNPLDFDNGPTLMAGTAWADYLTQRGIELGITKEKE